MSPQLDGAVVLITGAASGIGHATAAAFAAKRAHLGLIDCNEAALAVVVDELRTQGVKVESAVADLATAEGVRESLGELLAAHGDRVDMLVNNAGVLRVRSFDEATDDDWREAFDVHVMGAVRACRIVLPLMREQGGGSVLFVVSDLARHPMGIAPHYEASKTSLLSLIQILAMEGGPHNVRVNGVAPGPTDTPMLGPLKARLARQSDLPEEQAMREELRRRGQALGGRLVRPDEVAAALIFLASSEAITGAVFNVDGGTPGGLP
jgi:NAD(P)-dependent dehydrogenase (short-subunit alcohol dehydrogenase family)